LHALPLPLEVQKTFGRVFLAAANSQHSAPEISPWPIFGAAFTCQLVLFGCCGLCSPCFLPHTKYNSLVAQFHNCSPLLTGMLARLQLSTVQLVNGRTVHGCPWWFMAIHDESRKNMNSQLSCRILPVHRNDTICLPALPDSDYCISSLGVCFFRAVLASSLGFRCLCRGPFGGSIKNCSRYFLCFAAPQAALSTTTHCDSLTAISEHIVV
jgi:hypothetical protein